MMTDREKFETYFAPIAEGMKKCGVGSVGIERRKDNQWQGWQAALASQQPADDGWIEWGGGPRPVDKLLMVEPKLRSGKVMPPEIALYWNWGHCRCSNDDIIAYRVVKP